MSFSVLMFLLIFWFLHFTVYIPNLLNQRSENTQSVIWQLEVCMKKIQLMDSDQDMLGVESEGANVENQKNEEILFDIISSPEVTLEPMCKGNAKSGVWKEFGILKKGGRILQTMKNKIHCKLCFMDKILKRYVYQ